MKVNPGVDGLQALGPPNSWDPPQGEGKGHFSEPELDVWTPGALGKRFIQEVEVVQLDFASLEKREPAECNGREHGLCNWRIGLSAHSGTYELCNLEQIIDLQNEDSSIYVLGD